MALLAGSPAINAGDPAFAPATDQRGFGATPPPPTSARTRSATSSLSPRRWTRTTAPPIRPSAPARVCARRSTSPTAPRRRHDRLRHPGHGRADDQPALGPAHDHRPGDHQRLYPAEGQPQHTGRRRQCGPAHRAERSQCGDRRDRPDDHRRVQHGARASDQPLWRRRHRDHRIGASNNAVLGNFIGTNAAGTAALGNGTGVLIDNGASNNMIGGTGAGAGNVISGNSSDGIDIGLPSTLSSNGNFVQGNKIGTNAAGTAALGNGTPGVGSGGAGVRFFGGTSNTVANNVISGNVNEGIFFHGDLGASHEMVLDNLIGTNAAGTASIGNGLSGITLNLGCPVCAHFVHYTSRRNRVPPRRGFRVEVQ